MTWVIADFTASAAGQVTVTKGQQVELVDCCGGLSEMVLVRVPSDCTEGMVPHVVLKQPPSLKSPQATGKGTKYADYNHHYQCDNVLLLYYSYIIM